MPKMYDIWQIGLIYREMQASVAALEALGTAVVRSLPHIHDICLPYVYDTCYICTPSAIHVFYMYALCHNCTMYGVRTGLPRNPSELRRARGVGHRGGQVREADFASCLPS